MSRNSKTARKLATAKSFSGTKGPAKTTPKHGKTKAWHQIGKSNKPKAQEGMA